MQLFGYNGFPISESNNCYIVISNSEIDTFVYQLFLTSSRIQMPVLFYSSVRNGPPTLSNLEESYFRTPPLEIYESFRRDGKKSDGYTLGHEDSLRAESERSNEPSLISA